MEQIQVKKQYLTFNVDQVMYGVDIGLVTEIVGMQQVTPIPELPACIKGIMNLRGKIIPIMDMRLRLHKHNTEYDERTCVVVITLNDDEIGIVVDRVHEVINIENKDEILARDEELISKMVKVEEKVYMILDIKEVITIE